MLMISSWPSNDYENQYMTLYYRALREYGVVLGPPALIDDRFVRAHGNEIDVIQIQWTPEQIWRSRGTSVWAQARGVAGLRAYFRLAHSRGIKIVWTLHDAEPHEHRKWLDDLGYRVLSRQADLCIVHDAWAAEQFERRFGGNRNKVRIMEHGNYDGVFPPGRPREETLRDLCVDRSSRVLLCQGNIRPYKRYDLAIDVATRLGKGYHLIIAGGPPEPSFGAEVRRHAGTAQNVTLLLENQPAQTVSDLFTACDCFLLPYDKITGSGALLTAATLGRGVVASDLPYFRRITAPEPDAAVLFKPGSLRALEEGIREFFTKDVRRRHEASRRLADRVPWPKVVKPVVDWLTKTFPNRMRDLPGDFRTK